MTQQSETQERLKQIRDRRDIARSRKERFQFSPEPTWEDVEFLLSLPVRIPEQSPLREQVAALCHEQWSGWMRYLFENCSLIPESFAIRWKRQMNTTYAELPEDEKESDRKEADRILSLIDTHAPVDSQGAGDGMSALLGYEQGFADAATQMRTLCVEKVKIAIHDLSRTSIAAEQNAGKIDALIQLREELKAVTLDQVKQ